MQDLNVYGASFLVLSFVRHNVVIHFEMRNQVHSCISSFGFPNQITLNEFLMQTNQLNIFFARFQGLDVHSLYRKNIFCKSTIYLFQRLTLLND